MGLTKSAREDETCSSWAVLNLTYVQTYGTYRVRTFYTISKGRVDSYVSTLKTYALFLIKLAHEKPVWFSCSRLPKWEVCPPTARKILQYCGAGTYHHTNVCTGYGVKPASASIFTKFIRRLLECAEHLFGGCISTYRYHVRVLVRWYTTAIPVPVLRYRNYEHDKSPMRCVRIFLHCQRRKI